MADFSKKTQSDNSHLANGTSARFVHVDGSVTTPQTIVALGTGCRLLRVIINTVGGTLKLRTGSDVIAVLSATAGPGTFNYGVYCDNGLIFECSTTMDATIVFGK